MLSKPAAITVTRTSSPRLSSMMAPKMRLTSSSARCSTMSAAALTSCRPRSEPPAKESRTPLAPSIVDSSNGELMACSAAMRARFSPRALPMPIKAEPASNMTERTSAKSTLIMPGMVMMSVMPCTPLSSTSSAERNASIMERFSSPIWSRRSFGITISVSHTSDSA